MSRNSYLTQLMNIILNYFMSHNTHSEATKWMWLAHIIEAKMKKVSVTCNVYLYRYNIHWIEVEKATFYHLISNFPVFQRLELKFIAIAYGLIQYQVIIFINYRVNTFYLLHIHVGVLDELVSHTPSSTTSQTSSMSRSVYFNYIYSPISHTSTCFSIWHIHYVR